MKQSDRLMMEAYEKVAGKKVEVTDLFNKKISDKEYEKIMNAYKLMTEEKKEDQKPITETDKTK